MRALDIDNGKTLWQSAEPMAAHGGGSPITYRTDGRQYVVIMAGGVSSRGDPMHVRSDHVYAYALPN